MGGHEIRPNHMKVKGTQFRQDAECGGSNPAAPASQSGLHRAPRSPRGNSFPQLAGLPHWADGIVRLRLRDV